MTCMVQLNTQGPQCYSKKVGSNSLFPPSRYSPSVSCKKASEHVALCRHRAFIPITKAPCLFRTVWRWKTQIRGWKEGVQNKVKSLPPDGIQQIGEICVYFTATKLPVAFDVLKGNQVNCPLVSFYSTKGVTKLYHWRNTGKSHRKSHILHQYISKYFIFTLYWCFKNNKTL